MKNLSLLAMGALLPSLAFAANYTATVDGNFTDPATWGETELIPTAEDTFTIGSGVTVDITSAVVADKIEYAHNYQVPGILNIAGEDASLTLSNYSSLFYQYMMVFNVSGGANLDAKFNWGGGGYYKMNIDAATATLALDQFQGSKFDGDETLDSGIYLTNGAVATSASNWNLNPSSADHSVTVSVDNSKLQMSDANWLTINASGSYSKANIFVKNNSTVNNLGSFTVSGENAEANIEIENSTATQSGSTFQATGQNSTLNFTVKESSYTLSGDFKMLADATDATLNLSFIDNASPISITHMYIGARNGGTANYTMKNSEINTGFFYIGQHEYNLGSNVYNNGLVNLSLYNSKMTFTQFKVNYWDNSTTTIALSGNSKMVQSGSNTINFGTRDGEKKGGEVILQLGDYVDGNFVAAQSGAFQGSYEFFATSTSTLKFILGAENLTKIGEETLGALISARYFKPVQGDIILDFSNIAGLSAGYYQVALIACLSKQSLEDLGGLTASYNDLFESNVIETDIVKLFYNENGDCYTIKDGVLYANIEVLNIVPEPSTYAAIFGALALAFAAYRKRK